MTVETTRFSREFQTDGVSSGYSLAGAQGFPFLDTGQLTVIWTSAAGVSVPQVAGTHYTLAGDPRAMTAELRPISPASWAAGGNLRVFRDTLVNQNTDFIRQTAMPSDKIEYELDRRAMVDVELGARGLMLPPGEVAPAVGVLAGAGGKVLGLNADATEVIPMTMGGADAALRTDLASTAGGSLGRYANGLTFQRAYEAQLSGNRRASLANPPGNLSGKNWEACVPNMLPSMRCAAGRLSTHHILARVMRNSGVIDEFVIWDPHGFNGLAAGWFLKSHISYHPDGRVMVWLIMPDDGAGQTETDWVFNIGKFGSTYDSNGDGPDYYYSAKNHGPNKVTASAANMTVKLNNTGANLQDVSAWPVGTENLSATLDITENYTLVFGDAGGGNAATIQLTRSFMGDFGQRCIGFLTPLVANFGFNDSYTAMMALSHVGGWANRAKVMGEPAIIPLVGETDGNLMQKGNWTATSSTTMQVWNDADPATVCRMQSLYGPPVRKQGGGGVGPYGYNNSARIFIRDGADYKKFAMAMASSEEVAPRTAWTIPETTTLEWFVTRGCEIMPGGAA